MSPGTEPSIPAEELQVIDAAERVAGRTLAANAREPKDVVKRLSNNVE